MILYQRPRSPYWYVDLADPSATNGRRRTSTKRKDKREAELVAAKMLTQVGKIHTGPGSHPVTIAEALTQYRDGLEAQRLVSHGGYATQVEKLLGLGAFADRYHLDGSRMIHTITGRDIQALKIARGKEGNAPSTTGNELKALRAAVRAAVDAGAKPPSVTKWGVVESTARVRYLSPEEAHKVFDYLSPDRKVSLGRGRAPSVAVGRNRIDRQDAQDLFLTLLATGCRWGEVASLTWPQVRLKESKLIVKGKTGTREVPIVSALWLVLKRRFEDLTLCPLVFPGRGGKKRSSPCQAIQHAIDAVGLNDPALVEHAGSVCIHTLRHTYASWLRQRGTGLDEVQRLLGHSNMQTTARYAKVDTKQLGDRVGVAMQGLLPG